MFGLTPDIIKNIKEAFSRFSQIEKVILYGSRAKGDYKDGSDIDITLLGKNLNLKTVYALETVIEELYLPYTFDISIFAQIDNDDLIEHILNFGKIFYTKNNAQLPKGWEVKKLGEVAKINYGYTEKASFTEIGPKFLRITDIKDNSVEWSSVPYCECSDLDLPKYLLEETDIVFARTGATTGKSYLVKNPPKAVFASYLIRLKLISIGDFSPEFVSYYFQTKLYWDKISDGISGSAQGGFNATKLGQLIFPIPPLPEQKRIVAILDKAFTAISKAKANAEQNLKNAKELFESYLQGVFENKGEGWEEKTIEKVCVEIFAGGDAPKANFSKEINKKYKIPIYANAVKDNGLYGFTNFARVTKPSITIAARGSGTGHTEIRYEQFLPIVRLIVLIPNLSLVTLEFLKHSIDNLEILRSGSAIPQLTVPMMKEYKIFFPSITKQQTIVKKLDTLSSETKKLEAIYQQKIDDLEELKKSILQKAFNGEL